MRHRETPGPVQSVTRENSARDVHPGRTGSAESLRLGRHGPHAPVPRLSRMLSYLSLELQQRGCDRARRTRAAP